MSWQTWGVIAVVGILILDSLSGGYVTQKIQETFSGEKGNLLTNNAKCLYAVQTLPPLRTYFGITIFLPSWDDVSEAIILSFIVVAFIHLFFRDVDLSGLDWIIILIVSWLFIKLLALYLLLTTPNCKETFLEGYHLLRPFEIIGMVLAPFVLLKFLLSRIGK